MEKQYFASRYVQRRDESKKHVLVSPTTSLPK
jgi:hypothetical protein